LRDQDRKLRGDWEEKGRRAAGEAAKRVLK
jgi:hypothetical protein